MFRFVLFSFFLISFGSYSFANEDLTGIKLIIGKPYKIKKKWYYPKNNLNYQEIGIASVYTGSLFNKNKKKTKNGEIFSNELLVAKHKTLPLPSIVQVTNLNNGYAINVRVNDRGPKNNYRIIELSQKTANLLRINEKALVEIKVLANLTISERMKIKGPVSKYTDENLEENIALESKDIKTENLMSVDNKKNNIKKENYPLKEKKEDVKNLKLNFIKKNIEPYYLRIDITKFRKFKDAASLKNKMTPIYDKILINLSLVNNQKYYKLTTKPINNLNEAEQLLRVIYKNGFYNAKLYTDPKRK